MTISKNIEANKKTDKAKSSWLKFLYVGVSDGAVSEDTRRVFIVNLFSTVGILFTLPFGTVALLGGNSILGVSLIFLAFLYAMNHIYLRYTHNHKLSGNFVLYPLYALMIYIIYSGGLNGTGHVWIFSVPAVSLFVHGMKRGLIEIAFFTLALSYVMFFMDNHFDEFGYHESLKSRIVFAFLVVAFLSAIYEYSMARFNQELKETSVKLKSVAYIDSLTGLLNRRGMLQRLEKNEDEHFHLLLADADFFKRINDEYGHDAGDYALNKLSEIIQSSLPDTGFASRWGGEEFLIAISGGDELNVSALAEHVRAEVEAYEFTYQDYKFHMTLSIGIAEMNKFSLLDSAITLADNRLYHAKRSGRNQVRRN